jgi:hypothetical protein
MRAVGKATTSDGRDALPTADGLGAFCQYRRNQTEVTVNADKPVVLDQNLQTSDAVPLHANDPPRGNRNHRGPDWREKVNSIVKRPGQWLVRKNPRSERRRYTRGFNR